MLSLLVIMQFSSFGQMGIMLESTIFACCASFRRSPLGLPEKTAPPGGCQLPGYGVPLATLYGPRGTNLIALTGDAVELFIRSRTTQSSNAEGRQ